MAFGLFCVFLLLVQGALSTAQWPVEAADVHAYRIAAEKVAAGVDPYVAKDGNRTLQYLYPPTFILFFSPVLTLEGSRGLAWWSAMEMALLASIVVCIFRAQVLVGAHRDRVILVVSLLLFGPAWRNLVEGQINGIVILAMFAGVLLLEKKHDVTGGLLLAFAAHMKVLPAAALLVLLAQKRWKAAAAMGGWALLLVPVSGGWAHATGGIMGGLGTTFDLWLSWLTQMVRPVAVDVRSWITMEYTPWNHSFVAALHRLFDPEVSERFGWRDSGLALPRWLLRAIAWSLGGGGVILSLRLAARGRGDPSARIASFGFILILVNLVHAQTWAHHLISLAFLIPMLAGGDFRMEFAQRLVRGSVVAFAVVFTLPSMLAVLLPPAMGDKAYGVLFDAGRYGLPTIAIVLVWLAAFHIAWTGTSPIEAHESNEG